MLSLRVAQPRDRRASESPAEGSPRTAMCRCHAAITTRRGATRRDARPPTDHVGRCLTRSRRRPRPPAPRSSSWSRPSLASTCSSARPPRAERHIRPKSQSASSVRRALACVQNARQALELHDDAVHREWIRLAAGRGHAQPEPRSAAVSAAPLAALIASSGW